MLDIKFIRENADKVREAAVWKNLNPTVVDEVLKRDYKRRELLSTVEQLRALKNKIDRKLKKERDDALIKESIEYKTQIKKIEPELKKIQKEFDELMLQIPSVPADDVPRDPEGLKNKLVREWGEKPKFDFEPKDHIELGTSLDILDLDRGSKVAGYRGYFLKNEGALMHMGIMRYAMDKLTSKGFTAIIPPIINKADAFVNSGQFPWGEKEAYAIDNKEQEEGEMAKKYLAGTSEVPLVSYHANETLSEKDLPLLYSAFSPCYRREIGSYGKDTKGMYRVHEFTKIEQVVLCKNDMQESIDWHEKLAENTEGMLQELGLPYQVLLMCTGDMGEPHVKKYDIETWMPGRDNFGETMSDSIMGDFQSRRANIKYQASDGTIKFVHTLNNTALPSPRILIALWENHQQKDGSISIPPALRSYVGFDEIKPKKTKSDA